VPACQKSAIWNVRGVAERSPRISPKTVCPQCAGSLYVRYDLAPLKGIANRDQIARESSLTGWSGLWRYRCVLPDVEPVTLGEGWTPMLRSRRYPGVFLKEEGANPPEVSRPEVWRSASPWRAITG